MTNIDRTKLLMLGMKDLDEAVRAYEYERMRNPGKDDYFWDLPKHCTRTAIRRRIVQMRQDLLQLAEQFKEG